MSSKQNIPWSVTFCNSMLIFILCPIKLHLPSRINVLTINLRWHIHVNMYFSMCWHRWMWNRVLPPTPPFSIQEWGLISGPLSPAAICSSRTETRYLALCGRLEMELFIRPTLSCLLCAGFIIASAMFGRQYLSLVSCAATCLLFHWRWARALAIYHPLWGAPW